MKLSLVEHTVLTYLKIYYTEDAGLIASDLSLNQQTVQNAINRLSNLKLIKNKGE